MLYISDPIRSDPIRSDPIRSDPIRSDPIRSDPIRSYFNSHVSPPIRDTPLLGQDYDAPDFANIGGDHILIGCLFVAVMAGLGVWSLWQRRHAWGWWESPTTINVGLLVLGALCATPIFFGRESLPWWGHSYVVSAILTFAGLASFAITLRRRVNNSHGSASVIAPMLLGVAVLVGAYFASGAARNPWLLDPAVTGLNTGVRFFWLAVGLNLGYLLLIIAHYLLRLRSDTRRTDRGTITVYLGSCLAGMALVVIAIAVASGYGTTPAIVTASAVLFGLVTGGEIAVGGLSWRRKVARMRAVSRPREYLASDR